MTDITRLLDNFSARMAAAFDRTDPSRLNMAQILYYLLIETGTGLGGPLSSGDSQDSVLDRFDPTAALPSVPSDQDRYLATATANGWTIHYIYTWLDGSSEWHEFIPTEGAVVEVEDENAQYIYNGAAWVEVSVFLDPALIPFASGGTLASLNVAAALDELEADTLAHLADAIAAHAGTAISFASGGSLIATEVTAAIDELEIVADGAVTDAATAQAAADANTLKTAMLTVAAAGVPAKLELPEDTANGTNKVTFAAPAAVTVDRTITIPDADVALADIALNTTHRGSAGADHANIATAQSTADNHIADAIAAHAGTAISFASGGILVAIEVTAAIDELEGLVSNNLCDAVIAVADAGGGSPDSALTVDLKDLLGGALAKTGVVRIMASTTQYIYGAGVGTISYDTVTKGSILAQGNGIAVVKCDASGQFACNCVNTADGTWYFTAMQAASVDALANGVAIRGCLDDAATWA